MDNRQGQPSTLEPPKSTPRSLTEYLNLIEGFVDGRVGVSEFETRYLALFKSDATFWPEPTYQVLNTLFLDVDAYYPDPAIRGPDDVDEEELRRRAAAALAELRRQQPVA